MSSPTAMRSSPERGAADDPENQRKFRYQIDLAADGNVLLYGAQGSSVDELAKTMLLSAARLYGQDELWMYLLDLAAGSLSQLAALPHCGGVVLSGDDEQFGNLLRMLSAEIDRRRRLFMPYGGTLELYNARSGHDREPRIAVGIVNIGAIGELYADAEDTITMLTREGPRFGIHFLATAANASSMRMRIRNNFGLEIPTLLNDRSDYLTTIGSLIGIGIPHQERRGLVKMDDSVFEMQGASISVGDVSEDAVIEAVACAAMEKSTTVATPIPHLPENVHLSDMGAAEAPLVPVGFSRKGIEPVFFDLSKSAYMLVMGSDVDSLGMYLRGLCEALAAGSRGYAVVDPQLLLGKADDPHIKQDIGEVDDFLADVASGDETPPILVFTSIVQTIAGLSTSTSTAIQDYLVKERGAGRTSIIAATEAWRVRSFYQDWYKVVSAYGNGVWTGTGFADQTVFKFGRSLPEFRQPARRSDGFYAVRGEVIPVRLLEASDEPEDLL